MSSTTLTIQYSSRLVWMSVSVCTPESRFRHCSRRTHLMQHPSLDSLHPNVRHSNFLSRSLYHLTQCPLATLRLLSDMQPSRWYTRDVGRENPAIQETDPPFPVEIVSRMYHVRTSTRDCLPACKRMQRRASTRRWTQRKRRRRSCRWRPVDWASPWSTQSTKPSEVP